MLGNDNVHRKSARNRQCKVKECWEMAMYAEKMLGIHNVHRKMLGIINAKWENARNYRCKAKECQESSMYAEKILEIGNTPKENTWR